MPRPRKMIMTWEGGESKAREMDVERARKGEEIGKGNRPCFVLCHSSFPDLFNDDTLRRVAQLTVYAHLVPSDDIVIRSLESTRPIAISLTIAKLG